MMKVVGLILLLLAFVVELPVVARESLSEDTREESKVAHRILTRMMNECAAVKSDPTAHELLADVYRSAGIMKHALVEYQIPQLLAEHLIRQKDRMEAFSAALLLHQ